MAKRVDPNEALKAQIVARMNALGISVEELAGRLGYNSRQAVWNRLSPSSRAGSPTLATLMRYAVALETTLRFLLDPILDARDFPASATKRKGPNGAYLKPVSRRQFAPEVASDPASTQE